MNAKEYLEQHWIKNKVWKRLLVPVHQERFRMIASYLEGKTFADVGCAIGHSTFELSKKKVGKWTGIEFDLNAVLQARQMFPDIDFEYEADTGKLYRLNKFDGVVCSEVIEHVEHDQRLVDNLVSITEEVLVITTPCVKVNDPGHLRVYTEAMLKGLFKGHGPIEIKKTRRFFYVVFKK